MLFFFSFANRTILIPLIRWNDIYLVVGITQSRQRCPDKRYFFDSLWPVSRRSWATDRSIRCTRFSCVTNQWYIMFSIARIDRPFEPTDRGKSFLSHLCGLVETNVAYVTVIGPGEGWGENYIKGTKQASRLFAQPTSSRVVHPRSYFLRIVSRELIWTIMYSSVILCIVCVYICMYIYIYAFIYTFRGVG